MRTRLLLLLSSSLVACATPRVTVRVHAAAAAPRPATFEATLTAFVAAREHTEPGAPMPSARAAAWVQLGEDLGRFSPGPSEVARARSTLQSELQHDARAYGDVPEAAALAAQRLHALYGERPELRPAAERVDPLSFVWPVSRVLVSSPFGERVHPMTGDWSAHRGVDLATELGEPVRAAFAGTVVFAAWNGTYGKQVQLQHDAHWATHYGHLSGFHVESGARVEKGQLLGWAGSTGLSTGPHVHFEVLRDGVAVDPEAMLPLPELGGVAAR